MQHQKAVYEKIGKTEAQKILFHNKPNNLKKNQCKWKNP